MTSPADDPKLRVARARECNTQLSPHPGATTGATVAQLTPLKAASLHILERNKACNSCATDPQKAAQLSVEKQGVKVARVAQHSAHEARIRAWLEFIGERDVTMIEGCLARCVTDLDALAYFLQRAREVPEAPQPARWVTCAACAHFQPTDHPHLGHCTAGRPEAAAGLWDTDHRVCERFEVKP